MEYILKEVTPMDCSAAKGTEHNCNGSEGDGGGEERVEAW